MEKLTRREEELMRCFWERGPLFVRELVEMAPEPKPHFNTLSTMVRALESKGYVGHKAYGATYQYYPLVSEEEFSRQTLGSVISRYFENSYLGAVSALVEEEKISVDELRELIDRIQNIRKESGFEVTDKIRVEIENKPCVAEGIARYADYIASQTLAVEVRSSDDPQGEAVVASDVDEEPIRIAVTRV